MKVTVSPDGSAVIYRDEDRTVGVGLMGGYQARTIEWIHKHYGLVVFRKASGLFT